MMTNQRKLKQRIRARMERTDESYMTARRHVVGVEGTSHSGIHPDTSSLARILADAGVTNDGNPITEALVLGIGGGLGAGYILWEFSQETDPKPIRGVPVRRVVTIGFRNNWQYPDRWVDKTLDRLGVAFQREQTAGPAKAERQLESALASGRSVMADVSAADLPYWHLPDEERGWWGYPIAVTGQEDGAFAVYDRNDGRLTVTRSAMSEARNRIPSWKNRMVTITASRSLGHEQMAAAIEAGLADAVAHLASSSDSFSLPALAKWARMVDSEKGKGWRRVFADGQGLWRALRSTYESVADVGIEGGSLRPLYAEFLVEASSQLDRPELVEVGRLYQRAADAWDDVADAALPDGFEPLTRAAELARLRRKAVQRGDEGDLDAAEAAAGLYDLTRKFEPGLPMSEGEIEALFTEMSEAVRAAYEAEVAAHAGLQEAVGSASG
jgi:hypothetical protein